MQDKDEHWMRLALDQARLAARQGEVPVGAVLVDQGGAMIAQGHNQPISSCDPSAHAEMVVIRDAAKRLGNYRLLDTTLYVTLEPCVMCVGVLVHARVRRLVYGARELKTGAIESACQLFEQTRFNHRLEISSGVLEQPCAEIIRDFFAERRLQKKQQSRGHKHEFIDQ